MQHYITAWTTNDPEDIRALFTEDAIYATSPQEAEPWQGRDDIVEHWIAGRDEPDDWTFEWKLLGGRRRPGLCAGPDDLPGQQPKL